MKKIVRLTESDLIKIVKRVIQEQDVTDFESNISECFDLIPLFYFKKTTGMSTQEYDGGDLWFWNKNEIPELDDKKAYNRFINYVKEIVEYEHDGEGGLGNPEMILNEDCFDYNNPPSWKELLPHIKQMYYDTIRKKQLESQIQSLDSDKDAMDLAKQMFGEKSDDNLVSFIYKFYKKHNLNIPSAIRRRLSDSLIISLITKAINETPANDFYDPYDYADTILEKVINDNYSDFVYSFTNDEMHDEFYDFIKNEYSDIILDYWADVVGFDM